MAEKHPRIVITGMGTVNPLGLTVKDSWERAVRGESGVGPITLFDSSDLFVHIAGEVKGFDRADTWMSKMPAGATGSSSLLSRLCSRPWPSPA
jgi:3-oxoacyl-(acyl-carrier-protein) synthase